MRLWLSVVFAALAWTAGRAEAKLNVLFIMADDMRPELGCYGVPGMVTPNLDKLATTSVRFDRAYCQSPLCNPSRASLLSGRYPAFTEVLTNNDDLRKLHPDWTTLPQYFKQNGYYAATIGKIFHNGLEDPQSWDESVRPGRLMARSTIHSPDMQPVAAVRVAAAKAMVMDHINVLKGDGESHPDFYTAQGGIALLTQNKDKPFFIAVGFDCPHAPPTAPQKYFDLYDPKAIVLPPDFALWPTVPPGFPKWSVPEVNGDLFVQRSASPDDARRMIQAYRASVSWTDWNVGRVLDALDRLGLAKNTIVVFVADHGYHLGEKGKWSKHDSLFEMGTRVPLFIRDPEVAGNGRPCPSPVELVDLYPTLAQLCGLPPPPGVQGRSLASLLGNPDETWSYPAFSMTEEGYGSVRTRDWRYSEYGEANNGELLLDEQKDPHETVNLASDPRYADVAAKMKTLLRQMPGYSEFRARVFKKATANPFPANRTRFKI